MKKWMLSAIAAGALAVSGAASAQDAFGLGQVLPQILGNIGLNNGVLVNPNGNGSVQYDASGRRYHYDQYGRLTGVEQHEIVVDKEGRRWAVDSEGRHTQIGQDFGTFARRGDLGRRDGGLGGRRADRDRDGDGVADRFDRYPHDWRYR